MLLNSIAVLRVPLASPIQHLNVARSQTWHGHQGRECVCPRRKSTNRASFMTRTLGFSRATWHTAPCRSKCGVAWRVAEWRPFRVDSDNTSVIPFPRRKSAKYARIYLCEGKFTSDLIFTYSSLSHWQKQEARIAELEAEAEQLQKELGWVYAS